MKMLAMENDDKKFNCILLALSFSWLAILIAYLAMKYGTVL